MKTRLHVLAPSTITLHGIGDFVQDLLEPHRLKHDDLDRYPDWRFDYLCRFDATINCSETDAELPHEMYATYSGYVSRADRLRRDVSAGAVVTPDGRWHDLFDFGFRMNNDDESNAVATQRWNEYYWQLMRDHADCWVMETWAHS